MQGPEGLRAVRGLPFLPSLEVVVPGHFARHLTSMLMAFATGENVQYSDRRDIDQIMAAQPGKKTLRSLILGVIQSRAFQEK